MPIGHPKGQKSLVVSIAKSYDKRAVLSDVSLSVSQRAKCVGLLGPNGAGKTTCAFYSIMGLVKPDSGRITLDDGDDITNLPMYRRAILGLGYLAPGDLDLSAVMTVEHK